jgi:hypothetical protein
MQGALLRRAKQRAAEFTAAELRGRIERSGRSGVAVRDLVLSAPDYEHHFKRLACWIGTKAGRRCACCGRLARQKLADGISRGLICLVF